jgi:hypothetical protein
VLVDNNVRRVILGFDYIDPATTIENQVIIKKESGLLLALHAIPQSAGLFAQPLLLSGVQ